MTPKTFEAWREVVRLEYPLISAGTALANLPDGHYPNVRAQFKRDWDEALAAYRDAWNHYHDVVAAEADAAIHRLTARNEAVA